MQSLDALRFLEEALSSIESNRNVIGLQHKNWAVKGETSFGPNYAVLESNLS